MKSIEFRLKDGIAQVNSSSLTTMKLFVSSPPFLKVPWANLTAKEKFAILMEAFEGCKQEVPMPKDPNAHSKAILKELGAGSWKRYYCEGRHCSIRFDLEKREYCITPMIFLVENTALYGIKDGIVCVYSEASPEEIIFALEGVLDSIPRLSEEYYNKE